MDCNLRLKYTTRNFIILELIMFTNHERGLKIITRPFNNHEDLVAKISG